MEQYSDEWFAARIGKVTASRICDVIAKTKSGPSASRGNYLAELVSERLTGKAADRFVSGPMQWGTDIEPMARDAYSQIMDVSVDDPGFVEHLKIPMSGASPDGLIGLSGLLEIKCPNTATHIQTLLSEVVPAKYIPQIQWQMACTGREWCDFVSFDPRLPAETSLFVRRVEKDAEYIKALEDAVRVFLAEVDDTLSRLAQRHLAPSLAGSASRPTPILALAAPS